MRRFANLILMATFIVILISSFTIYHIFTNISIPQYTSSEVSEEIVLTCFNYFTAEGAVFAERFPEAVKEQFPNVTIEMEIIEWNKMHPTIEARFAANEVPDIMVLKSQDIPTYAPTGNLMDLTGQPFLDNVIELSRQSIIIDGREYGIPYNALYQGVFYNREIFSEKNLSIPQTYDELIKICEKLESQGITPFSTHLMDVWHIANMTMQFAMVEVFNKNPNWGYDLFDGKVSFSTSDEYRRVFEIMKDIRKYTFEDTFTYDQMKAVELFAKGEAAMMVTGTWNCDIIERFNPKLDYGIFPFPGRDSETKLLFEPNYTWAGSSRSENKELILKILEFIATDKELARYCAETSKTQSMIKGVDIISHNSISSDINKYIRANKVVDVNIGNIQIKWDYQEEYSRYIQEWLLDKITLDEALEAADQYMYKTRYK